MDRKPAFGRYRELPLDEMSSDERGALDNIVTSRGMVPAPYKFLLSNPRVARLLNPIGTYFNASGSCLTPAEREIVIVLVCAKWMASFPARVHEKFAVEAGLSPEAVAAMVSGAPTRFDDERQQVVYSLAATLLASRGVSDHLFSQAVGLIGDEGVADVLALIGYHCTIALTLVTYDVPAGAEELRQS
ncbi:carboxymuconolactone decarboxylase [Streptomyces sp. NPDC056227]|uniref:carboxymuconolactone decarboxylase n=1 Tax=Streptomyces sp. NPDC056227 TaxID=3345753 RepID=UPI0035E2F1D4